MHTFCINDGLRDGLYQTVVKEVLTPTREEIAASTRSASAKFRWVVKAF